MILPRSAAPGRSSTGSRRGRRVKAAAKVAVTFAASQRLLPQRRTRHRRKPLHKTRDHRRGAAAFGRIGEEYLARAKQLGEIVGGKADAALRRIKTERM